MSDVPKTYRLLKRGDGYYYHRRVPQNLVPLLGKKVIKQSLGTATLSKATQLRSLKDVEWDEKFRSFEKLAAEKQSPPLMTRGLALARLRAFVAQRDASWTKQLADDPPGSDDERRGMRIDMLEEQTALRTPDDPNGHAAIWSAHQEITQGVPYLFEPKEFSEQEFVELVRRALLELNRREVARLEEDFSKTSFDVLFKSASAPVPDTAKPSDMNFGKLCETYFEQYQTDAKYKGIAQKRIDKVQASLAVVSELVGADTQVTTIGHAKCTAFRELLSQVPTNANKHYPNLSLREAIERGKASGRQVLSYDTQAFHLATLNAVLRHAHKLALLQTVPSEGLAPWAPKVHASEKRRPFTPDELSKIFAAPIYTGCKDDGRGFAKPGPNVIRRARFWVPLICLFSGMRPNEVCQLELADVRLTESGTLYFDINDGGGTKKLKTPTSKRGVPVHPELMRFGFGDYVKKLRDEKQQKLFPEIKPGKYGYSSQQVADWFSDTFLPKVVEKDGKISLYSFRHNFRDALRRIEAPDWVMRVGGWAPSNGVSDSYGSGYKPDQLKAYVERIEYPGLDLSHLYFEEPLLTV